METVHRVLEAMRLRAPFLDEPETITLDQIASRNQLLRLIARHIDFAFIQQRTASLYGADSGRPAIDPVLLCKMLFTGNLFGRRSERQLVREIEVNVAYRWLLGFKRTNQVPDASTLSQNRRRRFAVSGIEQAIFDQIVAQAIEHRLLNGRVLYSDRTHLKASVNKRHLHLQQVPQKPACQHHLVDSHQT